MIDWSDGAPDPEAVARHQQEFGAAFMAIYGNPELASNPQNVYRKYREHGPTLRMGPLLIVNNRELVMAALHQPQMLSSGMASARLGNTRPADPHADRPAGPRKVPASARPAVFQEGSCRLRTVRHRAGRAASRRRGGARFVRLHRGVRRSAVRLGLPAAARAADADRAALVRAKDGIVHPPRHDMAEAERVQQAAGQELNRYFEEVVEAKRTAATDDLLTRLLGVEVDGRTLSRDEVVDVYYVLAGRGAWTRSPTR